MEADKFKMKLKQNSNIIFLIVKKGEYMEMEDPFTDVENGIAVNSGFLNGLESKEAIKKATEYIEENKLGTKK